MCAHTSQPLRWHLTPEQKHSKKQVTEEGNKEQRATYLDNKKRGHGEDAGAYAIYI